jgi:hypothetical protein
MPYNFIKNLNETANFKKIEQVSLPCNKEDLQPALSTDTINYHYGTRRMLTDLTRKKAT